MKPKVEGLKAPRVPKPKQLPASLKGELERLAEEILLERTAEARRIAALELTNVLLKKVVDLLGVANAGAPPSDAPVVLARRAAPPVVAVKNPCVMCGRKGFWQDKSGRGGKPWYCETHYVIAAPQVGDTKIGQVSQGTSMAEAFTDAEAI